jgi:DNA-binding FadR family transcriptional regulator
MSKENILGITLFVSVLVFNPTVAETLRATNNIQTQQTSTITTSITNILHKRGLDEDAARAISEAFMVEDEALFNAMLENLLQVCKSITKEEVLTYLSNEALFRKNVALEQYDNLIAMVAKIKQKGPNKIMRQVLHEVAKRNSLLIT